MSQVGKASFLHIKNETKPFHPLFKSKTGDHAWEDRLSAGVQDAGPSDSPGNPAYWTYEYLENPEAYFCPLVNLDPEIHFSVTPRVDNNRTQGIQYWGTSVYIYKKVTQNEDPYIGDGHSNTIMSTNDLSAGVMMVDEPPALTGDFDNWQTKFEHYNALMEDGSVEFGGYTFNRVNQWLWGKNTWAGQ